MFDKQTRDLQFFRSQLPLLIANEMELEALDNFQRQGFMDGTLKSWASRKPGAPRNSRAILVDSGRLRRGISKRYTFRTATVYVDPGSVPYARVHNEGERINVTQNVRPFARTRKGKREQVRAFKRRVNFQMPERRFIGPSKNLDNRITKMISDNLKRIL